MPQTLRMAFRSLLARRVHFAMCVLVLGLGIGAATAIYTTATSVLLRPLPYADPDRLVFLWDSSPERPISNLTPGRLVDFQSRTRALSELAAIGHLSVTLTGRGLPERFSGVSVSSNFFDVLGAQPLAGGTFHRMERDRRQVVLTEGLWRRRFAADRTIIGANVLLDGHRWTIAGVMPASFYWPAITAQPGRAVAPELFLLAPENDLPGLPLAYQGDLRQDRRLGYARAIGRLAGGVPLEHARAEIHAIARQLQREHADTDRGLDSVLVTARQQLLGHVRLPVLLLIAASALLLIASCANVANLQLMRLAERARDLRVHMALGASRRALAAQLLAESAVMALCAGALGVAFAAFILSALRAVAPADIPRLQHAHLDAAAAAFTVVASLLAGATVALLPLGKLRRVGDLAASERGATTRVSSRTRRALVAAEVATAVALVCGALLFGRSLARVQHVDIGIADMDRLLTFDVVLGGARRTAPAAARRQFFEQVVQRIRTLPGVRQAAAAATLPVGGDDFGASVFAEASKRITSDEEMPVGYQVVGTGWFSALGVPLLQGRDFEDSDVADGTPVVIINQALANALWPGERAVGRRLRRGAHEPWATIVGVVANLRHLGPRQPPRAELYQPMSQLTFSFAAFAVATLGDPHQLADTIRREVAALDPEQPISNVRTMEEHLRAAQAESRALWWITAFFAGLALTLAALGIYAAVGFSVTQRAREFGVRLALGAAPRQLGAQVLRETLRVSLVGMSAGLAFALAGTRTIQALLFDTPAADPVAYLAAAVATAAVAVLAGYGPARAAMRADPATALRVEI